MADNRTQNVLTPRDREILKDIILTYVLGGEPVSSRSVAKHGRLGLSAASIRNVMADLEEAGYLAQPHTSAGRVPTRAAYHLFIQSMMEARQVPALGETVLKTVEFVPLSGRKVLCVVVSTTGFVDNKLIEVEEEVPRDELVRISNYLTDNFSGLTLREIRDRLLRMMADERAQMNRMLARAIDLARAGLEVEQGPEVLVDGARALLQKPELADIARVRRMFDAFEDKARLVRMLNQCMRGQGVRVLIGEDSDLTSELDFSLVATSYGVGDRPLGTLGVFGPSRMEYHKMIPLVHYLGESLSRALAESFAGEAPGRR